MIVHKLFKTFFFYTFRDDAVEIQKGQCSRGKCCYNKLRLCIDMLELISNCLLVASLAGWPRCLAITHNMWWKRWIIFQPRISFKESNLIIMNPLKVKDDYQKDKMRVFSIQFHVLACNTSLYPNISWPWCTAGLNLNCVLHFFFFNVLPGIIQRQNSM